MLNNQQAITTKHIHNTILRVSFDAIVNDNDRMKSISALSRVSYIHYKDIKKTREKKINCIICKMTFENVFLLAMHLELQHSEIRENKFPVKLYEVGE